MQTPLAFVPNEVVHVAAQYARYSGLWERVFEKRSKLYLSIVVLLKKMGPERRAEFLNRKGARFAKDIPVAQGLDLGDSAELLALCTYSPRRFDEIAALIPQAIYTAMHYYN